LTRDTILAGRELRLEARDAVYIDDSTLRPDLSGIESFAAFITKTLGGIVSYPDFFEPTLLGNPVLTASHAQSDGPAGMIPLFADKNKEGACFFWASGAQSISLIRTS
jgi:hypothetical protein